MSDKYQCNICNKQFATRQGYWKHLNKNKGGCLPISDCIKLNQQQQVDKSRIEFYEQKVKEQEDEINRLKQVVDKIGELKDEVKQGIKETTSKIDELKEEQNYKLTPFNTTQNNYIINNNNQLHNNFSIKLLEPKKERTDHISKEQMLYILSKDTFTESVGEYMASMYFSPKAPENMNWCVTDLKDLFGALEYNHESNTVLRKSTNTVITKNLQIALGGMGGILEELRQTSTFSEQQGINYSRFYNIMGAESFDADFINIVKKKAYAGRHLSIAIWDHLNVSVEKTKLRQRTA